MKPRMYLIGTAAALCAAAILAACGSGTSASASSGPSATQLQSEITTLQNQVASLQTQVQSLGSAPAVFIKAPNATNVKAQLRDKAASSSCAGLGTLTGRPNTSDPLQSNNISGISCAGYYFTVSGAATSAQSSSVQPLPSTDVVYYDSTGCTGNAYVTVTPGGPPALSENALANGAVFAAANGSVLMLKPGTPSAQPNLLSVWNHGNCTAVSIAQLVVYAAVPNDSTVSGVPSGPITGPVTIQ